MRTGCIPLFTFILTSLVWIVPAGAYAEPHHLTLTAEYVDLQSITLRAVIRYQVITAFCIYKQDELSSFGFSTPFSVLGSVIHTGLLREMRNPLAYWAASSVFSERTDIRLTTSLDGSGYWGLALRPLPKSCLLYYYGKKNEPFSLGAVARLDWEKILQLEMLLSTSLPRIPEQSVDWFEDQPPFAGGRLVHAASRLTLRAGTFYGIVSGVFSCGSLVPPGYFFHTVCGMDTHLLSVCLIFGYEDQQYLDPEARKINRNIMYGGTFTFNPLDRLELTGKYRRTIEHGDPAQISRRDSSEELCSRVVVTVGIESRTMLYLDSEYTAHFYYPADSPDYITHMLVTTVTCDADRQSFTAGISVKNIGLRDQNTGLRLELELQNNVVDLVLTLKRYQEAETSGYDCRAAFFVCLPDQKYYLKLRTKQELDPETVSWRVLTEEFTRYFCLTLGWEGAW